MTKRPELGRFFVVNDSSVAIISRGWYDKEKTEGVLYMDVKQFGIFLQTRRKALELTQSELAEKLHVTDKAISRWERGVGFPDIKLLEPLADALELSITELVKCEVMPKPLPEEAKTETAQILEEQKQLSWKRRLILWLGYLVITAASLFLISVTHNEGLSFTQRKGVYAIAFTGGSLACKAWQFIAGGLYLKPNPWGIWSYGYTWVSSGMMLVGLWLAAGGWFMKTPAPVWNMVISMLGLALALGGWIYLAIKEEENKE